MVVEKRRKERTQTVRKYTANGWPVYQWQLQGDRGMKAMEERELHEEDAQDTMGRRLGVGTQLLVV